MGHAQNREKRMQAEETAVVKGLRATGCLFLWEGGCGLLEGVDLGLWLERR